MILIVNNFTSIGEYRYMMIYEAYKRQKVELNTEKATNFKQSCFYTVFKILNVKVKYVKCFVNIKSI